MKGVRSESSVRPVPDNASSSAARPIYDALNPRATEKELVRDQEATINEMR